LLAAFAEVYWQTRQSLNHREQEQAATFREQYPDEIRRVDTLLRQWAIGPDREPVVQQARQILDRYVPKPGERDLREFAWHYLASSLQPPTFPQLQTIQAHQQAVYCVAFSPDSKRLATASADGTARVWDAATGQLLFTLTGHTKEVNSVSFSRDGQTIATTGDDGTVRLWSGTDGTPRDILWRHSKEVTGVAFNPARDEIAAVTDDGLLKVWNANSKQTIVTRDICDGKRVHALAFSADGTTLATVGNHRLRVWNASKSYQPSLDYSAESAETVAVSRGGKFFAVVNEPPRRVSVFSGQSE
jgi:WD40 repeat protein